MLGGGKCHRDSQRVRRLTEFSRVELSCHRNGPSSSVCHLVERTVLYEMTNVERTVSYRMANPLRLQFGADSVHALERQLKDVGDFGVGELGEPAHDFFHCLVLK